MFWTEDQSTLKKEKNCKGSKREGGKCKDDKTEEGKQIENKSGKYIYYLFVGYKTMFDDLIPRHEKENIHSLGNHLDVWWTWLFVKV